MRPSRVFRGGMCFVLATLVIAPLVGCGSRRTEAPTAVTAPEASPASGRSGSIDGYTVTMSGGRFSPERLVVPGGETVTFVNNDRSRHAVIPDVTDSGGPNSDEDFPKGMKADDVYQWIAPTSVPEGTVYYYHCRYHGAAGNGSKPGTGMVAAVEISRPAPPRPQY